MNITNYLLFLTTKLMEIQQNYYDIWIGYLNLFAPTEIRKRDIDYYPF